MSDMTLEIIELDTPKLDTEKRTKRLKKAKERKPEETMLEAWKRIGKQKLSNADKVKLRAVKNAMDAGLIEREQSDKFTKSGKPKAFSKAEAIRLYLRVQEMNRVEKIAEMVKNTPKNYKLVTDRESLRFFRDELRKQTVLAVDCETWGDKEGDQFDPYDGYMAGFSVSSRDFNFYVPLNHVEKTSLSPEQIFLTVGGLLQSKEKKLIMHNAQFDCKFFAVQYGLNLYDNLYADTQIMSMALEENVSHRLKDLLTNWLKIESDNFDELFSGMFNEVPLDAALVYAAGDTEKTLKLFDWMMRYFNKEREDFIKLKHLVFDIEMPVCRQFIRSDLHGIGFDVKQAIDLDAVYEEELKEYEQKIYRIIGREMNLNSSTQISKLLYEELKIKDPNKGRKKEGSTGSKILKRIKTSHKIIPLLLKYRELSKLRSAFTVKLPKNIKNDGRIHQSHSSWGTKTGRFSCSNPNTQQMPSKNTAVRKLFVTSSEDRIMVSMDYSQIELRVLAHYANDPVLLDAFATGKDIHSTTAAQIIGVPYEQIEKFKDVDGSKEKLARGRAKTVNFGIVYGMTDAGLSQELEITKKEAQKLIDDYFKAYPTIKGFMESQKRVARKRGFVTDLYGRKRRLKDIYQNGTEWEGYSADRQSANFVIQSTAGSILKQAIVNMQGLLKELNVEILLQVHDELLFECPKDIKYEDLLRIREVMISAVSLNVDLKSDMEIYPQRWMEKVSEEEWFGLAT